MAIYMRDGENRTRDRVGTLFDNEINVHTPMFMCSAYVDDHFKDHVGRSFSRIRVYTDRLEGVPTASSPVTS